MCNLRSQCSRNWRGWTISMAGKLPHSSACFDSLMPVALASFLIRNRYLVVLDVDRFALILTIVLISLVQLRVGYCGRWFAGRTCFMTLLGSYVRLMVDLMELVWDLAALSILDLHIEHELCFLNVLKLYPWCPSQ